VLSSTQTLCCLLFFGRIRLSHHITVTWVKVSKILLAHFRSNTFILMTPLHEIIDKHRPTFVNEKHIRWFITMGNHCVMMTHQAPSLSWFDIASSMLIAKSSSKFHVSFGMLLLWFSYQITRNLCIMESTYIWEKSTIKNWHQRSKNLKRSRRQMFQYAIAISKSNPFWPGSFA
jgi:hypothetical protein